MADGLNRVMLLGNLGADPELRYTQGGQPVLNMRLATTESYLDKDKVRRERTDWHNVVLWGKRGEALAKFLTKGTAVFVEGRLQTSSYDDRDGNKRYKTEIVANNLLITNSRGRGPAPMEEGPPAESGDYGGGGGAYARGGGGGYTRGGGGERGGGERNYSGGAPQRPRPQPAPAAAAPPPAPEPSPPPDDYAGDYGGGGGDDDIPF